MAAVEADLGWVKGHHCCAKRVWGGKKKTYLVRRLGLQLLKDLQRLLLRRKNAHVGFLGLGQAGHNALEGVDECFRELKRPL